MPIIKDRQQFNAAMTGAKIKMVLVGLDASRDQLWKAVQNSADAEEERRAYRIPDKALAADQAWAAKLKKDTVVFTVKSSNELAAQRKESELPAATIGDALADAFEEAYG